MKRRRTLHAPTLDEALRDEWAADLGIREVPLENRGLLAFGAIVMCAGMLVAVRFLFVGVAQGALYEAKAAGNLSETRELPAPRGVIYDARGVVLAENESSAFVLVDTRVLLEQTEWETPTVAAAKDILGIEEEAFWRAIETADFEREAGKVLLAPGLTTSQLIQLKERNLPTLVIQEGFRRTYPEGEAFASLIGYAGAVSPEDLKRNPALSRQGLVGKAGLEYFYDDVLRGAAGSYVQYRSATGAPLGEPAVAPPAIGNPLHLTIDAEFQDYFAARFRDHLRALGRTTGVAIALNPKSGSVLALVNFPLFDNNMFSRADAAEERAALLSHPQKPLFNRAVSGIYNPGSTIKPLVAVGALAERIVNGETQFYSPGYLEVPNPYEPDKPSRFLDWRAHGWVDLKSAIAQSSNVYFYLAGGGLEEISGLGLTKLRVWWQNFRLGERTGIDLPFEAEGLLPDEAQKRNTTGEPWRLGDTYNVSIGQGDLLVTPIQLINYTAGIANGGTLMRPYIVSDLHQPVPIADLTRYAPHIREVQEGMRQAVTSPLGTAYVLNALPVAVAAKTGTTQVVSKTQENAFFVGYAPYEDPKLAILILIENSREGSLNTVPVARDVLEWYYWKRIAGVSEKDF
ncbi:MAG: hypothetical protein HY436_02015 [Candidatus Liptonbacteria bacterium]|nr:hypothetical protein [Candidatus Liptonbacteria bacterium]